jgi:NTP pyrophosphatase (non-canonical NTP hydrolase)
MSKSTTSSTTNQTSVNKNDAQLKAVKNDPRDDKQKFISSPFSVYFRKLDEIDKGLKYTKEYGSMLILSLVEEVGEMARAYLAEHGRKPTNLAAQADETYEEELGDILVSLLRFARIKKINLDERVRYSISKIEKRQKKPKKA